MRNFMKIMENITVNELFQNEPYEYSFEEHGDDLKAIFSSENRDIEVDFEYIDGRWYITFNEMNSKETDKYQPTGNGDQFNILNTVVSIILDFTKRYNPKEMTFMGEKKTGHGNLYAKIIKNYLWEIRKAGFKVTTQNHGNNINFSFIRENIDPMRRIMNICENGLLQAPEYVLRLEPNAYKLMRCLLFLANPDLYQDDNSQDSDGIMTFNDKITYNETKEKLKQFGMPFVDQTGKVSKTKDHELDYSNQNNISPYPKKAPLKRKKITPNPYRG